MGQHRKGAHTLLDKYSDMTVWLEIIRKLGLVSFFKPQIFIKTMNLDGLNQIRKLN